MVDSRQLKVERFERLGRCERIRAVDSRQLRVERFERLGRCERIRAVDSRQLKVERFERLGKSEEYKDNAEPCPAAGRRRERGGAPRRFLIWECGCENSS